jgi:hypothetical protein
MHNSSPPQIPSVAGRGSFNGMCVTHAMDTNCRATRPANEALKNDLGARRRRRLEAIFDGLHVASVGVQPVS